jgi:5-formyltetrahydrofolate cyclo-ligase
MEAQMTASQTELTPTKLALRRTVRAARQARTPAERDRLERLACAVALELPCLRQARCVAVYAALPEEPGTALLRAALRERGTRVLLPVITDDTTLTWAQDDGTAEPAGPLGIPEPATAGQISADLSAAEVVLVPAMAVDTLGTRLGRGRGYYDRALARRAPEALVLAVVHDDEVLDATSTPIPREGHDVVIQGALTPTRWMFFGDPPLTRLG